MSDRDNGRRGRSLAVPILAGVASGALAGVVVAALLGHFMRRDDEASADPARELLERIVHASERFRSR